MAATSLRILLKEAELTELKQRYNFQLARSLVRLGEVHNRRAKPELRHDEHTERAIKYLNEARNIIEALEARGVADLDGLSSLHPDCLRHLGDAYRAMDQEDEVKNAIKYHAKAKRLWVDIGNKNEAGGELTRIGEVHRRLCDLNPKEHSVQLDKAIGAFKGAVEIRGGGKYLKALIDIESPGGQANLSKERKWLIEGSMEGINAHHLASSLTCLAEVKMHKDSSKLDLEYAAILLDCASECYCLTQEKLDEKVCSFVNKIIKKERNLTLKDDLGWCLTLHGYALIRQGMEPFEAPEDPDTYYKDVCEILDKAGTCYKAPDVDDEGHLVLNLFALSLAQFKLYEEEEAQTTLLEACRLLRRVIRKQKKVWYNDYIRDIIDELQDNKFLKEEGSHLGDVRKWLDSEHVRNGRRGLDEIIRIMDEKLNK
jgi:tetratricopeptide (TPR) repeat protein